jgi:predicted nucleic acid-binding protein
VATTAALLDACVLYPAQLRDLLLSLAASDLFRPKWSNMIHEEWITNILANRPDLTRKQLERTRDVMNQRFLDALVQGFEPLIPALTLPDPNDRHVLAAAIHSRADVIVTANLKHFPQNTLRSHGIGVSHPDGFVDYLFDLDEDEALAAVAKMRGRLRAPSMTPSELIDSIKKAGLPTVATRLSFKAAHI